MQITINKDIEQYEHNVWKGLSARQLLYGVVAVAATIGIILIAYMVCNVPIQVAIYFGIPIGIVIGLFGFLKIDDMTLLQFLCEIYRLSRSKPLVYESEEYETEEKRLLEQIRSINAKTRKEVKQHAWRRKQI